MKMHLHRHEASRTVWCNAKQQGGWEGWMAFRTEDIADVTCHACLEATVLRGDAAVARIIELDVKAGKARKRIAVSRYPARTPRRDG